MLRDATYKEKLALLDQWLVQLVATIKSDLKNDHLRRDASFAKRYFNNKNLNKITPEELAEGYKQALNQEENSEEIADFLFNRWLLKNSEIYDYFEERLRSINPNFTELTEIEPNVGRKIMEESVNRFGAPRTLLFTVINSVVFPKSVYDSLEEMAKKATLDREEKGSKGPLTVESAQKLHEQEMTRLTDKYEKKLQGLQKKYIQDTESLKKQLSILQRKLHAQQ